MTTRRPRLLAAALASAVLLLLPPHVAHADVVDVDPGAIAAGRPITGTPVSLPPLPTSPPTLPYNAGAQFASAITAYYSGGTASTDQAGVTRAARTWTLRWLDRLCDGRKPAKVRDCQAMAVFDIDETLLDNYAYYSTQTPAFTYSPATWVPFQASCQATAIAATARLFRALRDVGMGIALITGRNEGDRGVTEACLRQNGIDGWTALVMRDATTSGLTAAEYKAQARRTLRQQGWRIGPSIGDQVSDMAGGFLRHGFLLPNPMYYIP
jgi:hypothetical protein